MSSNTIENFWQNRYLQNISNPNEAANFALNLEKIGYDLKFIMPYLNANTSLLDLGSGPLAYSNLIAPQVKEVVAVDQYTPDLHLMKKYDNIECVMSDVLLFNSTHTFDTILLFAVTMYMTEQDARALYNQIANIMHANSTLIIKSPFAIHISKHIDRYSDELAARYEAFYRTVEEEQSLMPETIQCEVFSDVYPIEINSRHVDTMYKHMICTKKERELLIGEIISHDES